MIDSARLTNDQGIHCWHSNVNYEMNKSDMERNTDTLLQMVITTLGDGKGRDIMVVDVRGKTSITDYMVVASGTSERHVKSLAGHVAEEARKNATMPLGIEGEDVGEWVLVDLGDVIVHVMKPQTRDFYQLEKLWRGEADMTSLMTNSSLPSTSTTH